MHPTCYLTRIVSFSASHRLHSYQLTDEENHVTYGKCNNPAGHGHNYKLEVTICGQVDPKTGMVINLSELQTIIQDKVLSLLDHKNIDQDVEYFVANRLVSTTENVANFIWKELCEALPHNLYEIKLWETEKNVVTYRR